MGCSNSKDEESPIVALCRERRQLIRAASDHRFALADAHTAYFTALGRVGDALQRFVEAELVAAPLRAPESPVLTLPPSEGKGKAENSVVENFVEDFSGDGGCIASKSSSFDSISPLHSEDSHLHFHSESDSDEVIELGENDIDLDGGELSSAPSLPRAPAKFDGDFGGGVGNMSDVYSFPNHVHGIGGDFSSMNEFRYPKFYSSSNPNYYYMKKSSTVPLSVYQNPYSERSNSAYIEYGYRYGYGHPYDYPGYSAPMDQPGVGDDRMHQSRREVAEKMADPPPPAVENSSWDFFNPFNSYEQLMPGYLEERYGVSSVMSSPNSTEVREKEGIPDLEEETEQEYMKPEIEKKVVDKDSSRRASSFNSSLGVSIEQEPIEKVDPVVVEGKDFESVSGISKLEGNEIEGHARKKTVSFEEVTSLVKDEAVQSKGSALSAKETRDVAEAIEEIKEHFKSASGCGKELSEILEVGKLKYKPSNRILKVILSRILGAIILPTGSSELNAKFSGNPVANSEKVKKTGTAALCMDFDPGNLSSTLEQLCAWEVKLYKEVKEVENLRAMYERTWYALRTLDENGAEAQKIDSTRALLRRLVTRINKLIRSIDHISARIHKLRDEKLQPQVIELIQGLVRMWNSVLECHHKQFQAIADSKGHNLMAKTGSSVAKVTIELEMEMLNWCSCFTNWIRTLKAYIGALNGWLMKWLLEEKEETPDGPAPFSPGRIGAPIVFVVANDWYNIMDRISVEEVIDTMQAFAINVHRLWETQGEEQQQRLKAEYLSRDLTRRLRLLQKENGIQGDKEMLDKILGSHLNKVGELHGRDILALNDMRKRLEDEKSKHLRTINQVQQATISNLRSGLLPIFESLEKYSAQNLRGYEAVRIPDDK